jgi:hypothetical protein
VGSIATDKTSPPVDVVPVQSYQAAHTRWPQLLALDAVAAVWGAVVVWVTQVLAHGVWVYPRSLIGGTGHQGAARMTLRHRPLLAVGRVSSCHHAMGYFMQLCKEVSPILLSLGAWIVYGHGHALASIATLRGGYSAELPSLCG